MTTMERVRETVAGIAGALGELFSPKDPLVSSGIDRIGMPAVELRAQHAVASAIRIHAQREAAFSVSEILRPPSTLG